MSKEKIPKSEKTKEIEKSILDAKSQIEKLDQGFNKEKEILAEEAKKLGFNEQEIKNLMEKGILPDDQEIPSNKNEEKINQQKEKIEALMAESGNQEKSEIIAKKEEEKYFENFAKINSQNKAEERQPEVSKEKDIETLVKKITLIQEKSEESAKEQKIPTEEKNTEKAEKEIDKLKKLIEETENYGKTLKWYDFREKRSQKYLANLYEEKLEEAEAEKSKNELIKPTETGANKSEIKENEKAEKSIVIPAVEPAVTKNEIENKDTDEIQPEILPAKIENLDDALKAIELVRKEKLENGPQSLRIKKGVMDGLKSWEKFGIEQKDGEGKITIEGSLAKRLTKMSVNLLLIGAISSISVDQLAKHGIGPAPSLGGSVTTALGKKMAIGLGFGTLMETISKKTPDKVKKWIPRALIGASIGFATIATGGIAAPLIVGGSAALGWASSKFIKGNFTEEKILEKEKKAKEEFKKEFEGLVTNENVSNVEKDYEKLLKKYENMRIWGKILDEGTKILVGSVVAGATMEASGFIKDEIAKNHKPEGATIYRPEPIHKIEPDFKTESVEFSGKGAIQTIENLKAQISHDYPDLSKAPHSVQEFMHTNSTQEAIKLGLYNPNDPSGQESATLWKGSTMEFDEKGNLSFHDIKNGETHSLISEQGSAETIEKYQGKMFDSDNSAQKELNILSTKSNDGFTPPTQEDPLLSHDTNSHSSFTAPTQTDPTLQTENSYRDLNQLDNNRDFSAPTQEISHLTSNILNTNNKDISPPVSSTVGVSPSHYVDLGHVVKHETLASDLNFKFTEASKIYDNNIHQMFPDEKGMEAWNQIKDSVNTSASVVIHMNPEQADQLYRPLINELHKLREVTGLEPISKSLIEQAETPNEYIIRAMQKATEMGKLDAVKI